MISGQVVTLTVGTQTVRGRIIMGSDNRQSLMVGLVSALHIGGGFYLQIPLLMDEAGVYRDLLHGEAVEVDWSVRVSYI